MIDCSTSQPSSSAIINAQLLKVRALFVDAPLGRACDQVGVSRQAMYDLMSKGPLQGGLLQATVAEILRGNYASMKFSVNNAFKDIGYFNNMLDAKEANNSLSYSVLGVLVNAVDQDLGDSYLPNLVKAV